MKMNRTFKKIHAALFLFALLASLASAGLAADGKDPDSSASHLLSWEVTGPLGGDVRSLVVDPQDPQRLYFGTIDGQIYTTTDGGDTWSRLEGDRKSTRLNSSHANISYAVFCLKKKKKYRIINTYNSKIS